MSNFLNIIIIGEDENEISKTLDSIKILINRENIKIIIIFPKSKRFKLNFKKYQNIFLAFDEGKGIYNAMNKGLEFVERNHSYIWFLNSGDYAIRRSLYSQRFKKNHKEDIVFFISKNNLNLNKYLYNLLKFIKKEDIFIIKFLIISQIIPSSHQNIFIKKSSHSNFPESYKYSSDFYLITKLVFLKQSTVKINVGSLADTSYGGVTDLHRYKTLKERYIGLKNVLKNSNNRIFIPIVNLFFVLRIILLIPRNMRLYFLNFLNN